MEVKLAHQESELVSLLKKIPLGPEELSNLREKAERLRDGTLSTIRGEALLPIMLASYIFESLVILVIKAFLLAWFPNQVQPEMRPND